MKNFWQLTLNENNESLSECLAEKLKISKDHQNHLVRVQFVAVINIEKLNHAEVVFQAQLLSNQQTIKEKKEIINDCGKSVISLEFNSFNSDEVECAQEFLLQVFFKPGDLELSPFGKLFLEKISVIGTFAKKGLLGFVPFERVKEMDLNKFNAYKRQTLQFAQSEELVQNI